MTAPASPATVSEMLGVVHAYLQGPEGISTDLEPRERGELADTRIGVVDAASAQQLRSAGGGTGQLLLGLFTTPPATIQLFAADIAVAGQNPTDVLLHEMGHRFGFDHTKRAARAAMFVNRDGSISCNGLHDLLGNPLNAEAHAVLAGEQSTTEPCATGICRMHTAMADCVMLLRGLRERSWLAAQPNEIPVGLGGVIPLCRARVAEAQLMLPAAAEALPGRGGEVRDCARLLDEAGRSLRGWLNPLGVSAAYDTCLRAWEAVFYLNQAYWLQRHPEALPSDYGVLNAFRP